MTDSLLTEGRSKPSSSDPQGLGFKEELFRFTERFGHLMSRIILTALYILLVGPAAIFVATFGDRLGIRKYRGTSYSTWTRLNENLEQARRQG